MVLKFEKKIQELGIDENKLSAKIRGEIAEIREAIEDGNADEEAVGTGDDKLVKMITRWHQNAENLKKAHAVNTKAEKGAETTPPPAPAPAPTPTPAPAAQEPKEEGGSIIGTIFTAAAVVALGIFGIRYFKNK